MHFQFSSRMDVHFAETRTPYSPDEGILLTCHDWGLLSALSICQLFLTYQRKTWLLNQVSCHRIKSYDSGKAEIVMFDQSKSRPTEE